MTHQSSREFFFNCVRYLY